jgi:lantibiotic biosynthesis protein
MPWTPLLEGPVAAAAAATVRTLARDVAAAPLGAAPADRTLFWAYATRFVDEPFAHAAYDTAMDDLLAALYDGASHASLHAGGLAGIGWTMNHLLDGGAFEDVLEVIDEALAGLVATEHWTASNDLTRGLVGYGVYFLDRLAANPSAATARAGLAHVVRHLGKSAVHTDDGVTWLTAPAAMPAAQRERYPDGAHDCGVAHGVPGMIAVLARAARTTDDATAGSLSADALRWLAARKCLDGQFPALVPPAQLARGSSPFLLSAITRPTSRTAWCYGDPGIAAALWRVSPELARETALAAAARAECSVGDAGLCHGAAGLAHLYNRFYQATGEALLRDAACDWFARTLAMQHARRGHGLLEGTIGIGLALLAAISGIEPGWDRMLLCDLGANG